MEHHSSILLTLFIAFAAAKVAAEIMERLGQPAVVGELGVGLLVGPSVLGWVEPNEVLLVLAELGVIILLFQVGLETDPSELRSVGGSALAVGVLGVAFPFVLGYGVSLIAGYPGIEGAFVATALVATSVGVTARVLADMGVLTTPPSRVILGAAVIDDILGLIVLTIVVGFAGGGLTTGKIVLLVLESLGFVAVLMIFGPRVMNRVAHLIEAPKIRRAPFVIAILILLGLSASAEAVGLAAIVGAFLAGTALSATRDRYQIEHQVEPVADLLTPFFFVVTGARIDIGSFTRPTVLALAAAITAVAIVGKLIGGYLGARKLGNRDAAIVGVGMVPRGEVGIIVASLALSRNAVGPDVFGAVLAMVVVTTLAAPPVLKPMFARRQRALSPSP